jgi:hypothetical protein
MKGLNTLRNRILFGFLFVMTIVLSIVGFLVFDSVSTMLKNNAEKHFSPDGGAGERPARSDDRAARYDCAAGRRGRSDAAADGPPRMLHDDAGANPELQSMIVQSSQWK